MSKPVPMINFTSVDDGLSTAALASESSVRRALAYEKSRRQPRTALVTGLERELRRRAKAAGKKRAQAQ